MIIKNASVLTNKFEFDNIEIGVKDGKFVLPSDIHVSDELDMTGKYIVPGLIDIHLHGAKGCQAEDDNRTAVHTIAKYLLENGTTTFAPTLAALSYQQTVHAIHNIKSYINDGECYARIAGIHMEGPYFSHMRKGGQDESVFRNPNLEEFRNLNEVAGGCIKLISIAPELEGAMEFIDVISKDCVISIGHTDCNYETALEAIGRGASNITHTFNGMRPFNHREPNVLGAAFDTDVTCECISDGYHLHSSTVRTLYKLVGDERLVFISDCCVATGLEDGEYISANKPIYVRNGKTMMEDGTIAGGCTSLLGCVKKAIEFGIPAEAAFKCASYNPAKVMKIENTVGSIEIGKTADFLVLDKNFELLSVYKNGELVTCKKEVLEQI